MFHVHIHSTQVIEIEHLQLTVTLVLIDAADPTPFIPTQVYMPESDL